jgi:hypothetical protein
MSAGKWFEAVVGGLLLCVLAFIQKGDSSSLTMDLESMLVVPLLSS